MKKKFTINPKLKTYSALAGSFLAAGNMADASIVYHDVNPDVTKTQSSVGTSSYAIDMNNDGTTDFTLDAVMKNGTYKGIPYAGTGVTIVSPNSNNNVIFKSKTTGSITTSYAVALNLNDNINNSQNWYTGTSSSGLALAAKVTGGVTITINEFHNVTDKYIGVRFTANSNTYYGWIRVDVGNYNTFTVKDWAYENTPGQSILAGQTVATGVNTYLNTATTIKNINNVIEAEFASSIQGKVQIVNISGSVIKTADVDGNSCSINMQGMPSGIYNVVVSAKEGSVAKKVFVE